MSRLPGHLDSHAVEGTLWLALHSFAGSREGWDAVREHGLDDDDLEREIARAFGIAGGASGPGKTAYAYKGGSRPAFWHGTATWHDAPTLEGQALVDATRRLLRIPHADGTRQLDAFAAC